MEKAMAPHSSSLALTRKWVLYGAKIGTEIPELEQSLDKNIVKGVVAMPKWRHPVKAF